MGRLSSHTSYTSEILDSIVYELEYLDWDAFRELENQKKEMLGLDKSWAVLGQLLANENDFIGQAIIYGYHPIEHSHSNEHFFSYLTNQDLKIIVDFLDGLKLTSNYDNFKKIYFNSNHDGHKDEEMCKSYYHYLSELHKFHKECIPNGYGVLIQMV